MSGPTYVRITADVTDLTAKLAIAKAEFANTNTDLRKLAQQMNQAGESASGELKAGLQVAAEAAAKSRLEMAKLNSELRETTNATHGGGLKDIISFGESGVHIRLREMAEAFTGLGAAIAAVFVGKEILEGIEHTAELGAELLKLSEQTGVSTATLSAWHYAAEQQDVSAEALDNGIKKLGRSMQEALVTPTSNAAQAFHAMGISQEFLKENSNNLQAVLMKMADAFHDHAEGARADAVAMAAFGRAGVDMIPFLRQGSAGIQQLMDKARELGIVIDQPVAESMKEHVQAVKDMKAAWEGAWISLSSAVLPVITFVAHSIEGLTMLVKDSTAGIRAFASAVGLLNGAGPKGEAAEAVSKPFHIGSEKEKPEFANFEPKEKKTKEPKDFYAQWKEQLDQTLLAQQLFGQQAEAFELKFWQEKLAVAEAGGKNYVGATRQITSTVYQLESQQHRQEIEEQRKAEQEKKRLQDEGYRNFRAKIEAEREAAAGNVAEQIRLDQQLVERAKTLYGQDSANFQDALRRKLADMKAQIDQQMAPIKRAADSIANSFDQMFRGMLEGTMSFRQAMGRLTLSLIEDFARMAIRNVENWALSKLREVLITEQTEAQKTAATAAGAAAQGGVKAAAAAEGKAAEAVAGSASVFADANKAAAGAYSAVAGIPIVGPVLAPIAAATAFGAVLAFDVFSASGGMDIGPGVNPITQLHEKEMVLPAGLSERVRNMTEPANDSGDEVHFHYHAPAGTQGDHRSNARDMVDEFNHAVRIGKIKLKRA